MRTVLYWLSSIEPCFGVTVLVTLPGVWLSLPGVVRLVTRTMTDGCNLGVLTAKLRERCQPYPLGLITFSHSWLTPFSQLPLDGSGKRSLGARCVLPSSTT
jgi:hypothetical protein